MAMMRATKIGTAVDGKYLLAPPSKFGGVIKD